MALFGIFKVIKLIFFPYPSKWEDRLGCLKNWFKFMCLPQIIRRDMKTLRWTSDHLRRLLSSALWGKQGGGGGKLEGWPGAITLQPRSIGGTLPTESGWPNAEAAPRRVLSYLKEMFLKFLRVSGASKQLLSLIADSSFIVWWEGL